MLCQNCFNVRKQKTTSDRMVMCLQCIHKLKIKNGVDITIIMAFLNFSSSFGISRYLHISILNSIVNHLNKMSCTITTNLIK